MEIKELHLKNFGKFSDRHFFIEDGIHIFYGENEYGKSTLYAFIKAMLFGMERSRGRAASQDEFSRFQPDENPNYYAGSMRFTSGGKCFKLERNFDRYAKSVSLICEDDGEELSVEDGDLEMLLGGLTRESFENTAAIGQLAARPGQELAEELNNYAANYYETGSGNVDLSGALDKLRGQRKLVEQEMKKLLVKQEAKKDSVRQECKYVSRDAEKLQLELEENQEQLNSLQTQIKQQTGGTASDAAAERGAGINGEHEKPPEEADSEAIRAKSCLAIGGLGMIAGAAGRIWSAFLAPQSLSLGGGVISALSWLFLLIGLILIILGTLKRIKSRRTEADRQEPKAAGKDIGGPMGQEAAKEILAEQQNIQHRLQWESQRIKEEWKENKIRFQNLQEQLLELEEPDEKQKNLRIRSRALELAEEKMKDAAQNMLQGFGEILNQKASRIIEQITQGRYVTLMADEQLNMALMQNGRRITVDRLSAGTIEQVYFAIRMAAAEILYDEPLPVIFDDAFAFYDEKRLKSTLKWLREQQRQVIIFTCQKREQEIVKQF